MITHTNHTSFTVSSIEQTVTYYRDVLGLELIDLSERSSEFAEKATGLKGAHLKIAYFNAHNTYLEMIEYVAPKGIVLDTTTNNVGSAHVCFDVDDFESVIQKVQEGGGHLVGNPQQVPAGPNKGKMMVYTKDPDGNTLEFFSNKRYEE